jgi:hypothetical protein
VDLDLDTGQGRVFRLAKSVVMRGWPVQIRQPLR